MKIGVITEQYATGEGTGLFDFLKIVLRGIESEKDNELYLFFRSDNKGELLRRFPVWLIKIAEKFIPEESNNQIVTFQEFKNAKIVEYRMNNLNEKIIENGIDVVFPSMIDLGKNLPVKWCLNVWDCQHKYYPQYFSWYMMAYRDWFYNKVFKYTDAIVVNSQNAKNDFSKFYNVSPDRIKALPLLPTMDHALIGEDDDSVLAKYNLTDPYFIISNRFWKHKSHDVAIKALSIIVNERKYKVSLVCTGGMTDYRDKKQTHLNYLKKLVEDNNLQEHVRFLGIIPKKDQIELMKRAISVVQPSQFEGDCSGQIIDAITIGQRAICSDIEPLTEVKDEGHLVYFKLDNVDELAERMELFINTPYQRPLYDELIKQEAYYLKRFSDEINRIIKEIVYSKS